MSNTWTAHLRIEEVYDTEGANHPLRLQETDDPYDPLTLTNFFARDNDSDISDAGASYRTLEKQQGTGFVELSKTVPATADITILIEQFATNNTDVAEHTSDEGTSFVYSVWWTRGSTAPDATVKAKCEFYHRDASGSETLMGEFSQTITTTERQYSTHVATNEIFETDERFVVKWYADFELKSGF